jgi:hydroxymethylglutaryl-CoA synthase
MTDTFLSGVLGAGAYAPSLRLSASELAAAWGRSAASGVSETAVPDADEDALTMAYEATTRAVSAAGVDPDSFDRLTLATTTPPVDAEDLTARLGAMLGVPDTASRTTDGANGAAGVRVLVDAARREERSLVVAADCPRGVPDDAREHAAGAGAAAFVVDPAGPLVVGDASEFSTPYPGTRFRRPGARTLDGVDVTAYDRAAFSGALTGAADGLSYDPDTLDAVAIQAPDGSMPDRVTDALGVEDDPVRAAAVVHDLGDLGAASVPVGLVKALEDGAERLLAAGYGSGSTAVLAVLVDGPVSVETALDGDGDRELDFAGYVRRRGDLTSGTPEGGGAYVSVPTWRRALAQRYRLEAGRCPECGTLSIPPRGACRSCHVLVTYEMVTLDRTGTVEAVSVVAGGGAPPEFADLQARAGGDYATAVVAFDGPDGGSASLPVFVVGTDPESVAVGDRVEATVRRVYTQEGVTRYGLKVKPR